MKNLKIKKEILIIGGVVLAVIVAIVLGIVIFSKKSNEKQLEGYMKELASSFYEDFYWKGAGNTDAAKAEFLGKYAESGIKIDLDNLSRYNGEKVEELVSKMVNGKTKKECNRENTKVTIYPKEPYGKSDYTVEVTLDCGFKDSKKEDK